MVMVNQLATASGRLSEVVSAMTLGMVVSWSACLGGCGMGRSIGRAVGTVGTSTGTMTITSTDSTKRLMPVFTTAVFRAIDEQTADVYLTDLPMDQVRGGGAGLNGATGSIVHIHVFLLPQAGDTPIDTTACNVTVRHLLIAGVAESNAGSDQSVGLFGGGGFIEPSGSLRGESLGGRLSGASHRLVRATAGFADQLGPATIVGTFDAVRDDQAVRELAASFETLATKLPSVRSVEQIIDAAKPPAKPSANDASKPAGKSASPEEPKPESKAAPQARKADPQAALSGN